MLVAWEKSFLASSEAMQARTRLTSSEASPKQFLLFVLASSAFAPTVQRSKTEGEIENAVGFLSKPSVGFLSKRSFEAKPSLLFF
jgi:mannose-1-phosphate guanylyltransferase